MLKDLPNIPYEKKIEIQQGYLSTNPEVRIRSYEIVDGTNKGHKDYMLTVKGSGDLSREEIEVYISEDFFYTAAKLIGKPLIRKQYVKYLYDGHVLECSIVDASHETSFVYGEVEFASENEALNYQWPFVDATDITYDSKYKMKNYWLNTRCKEAE